MMRQGDDDKSCAFACPSPRPTHAPRSAFARLHAYTIHFFEVNWVGAPIVKKMSEN